MVQLLSVLIVSYNSHRDVEELLSQALAEPPSTPVEFIVVDNASPDGSGAVLREAFAGRDAVTVVCNESNLGFAEGCNVAARRAAGDVVLLLNPDARIDGPTLDRAMAVLGRDGSIAFLGPLLVDERGRVEGSFRDRWSLGYLVMRHLLPTRVGIAIDRRRCAKIAREGSQREVGWLLGACIFVRREVWDRLGGLDPEFFLAADDTADLCARGVGVGARAVVDPSLVAHHRGASTWEHLPKLAAVNMYKGHLRFAAKHHSAAAARALRGFFLVVSSAKAALAVLRGCLDGGRSWRYAGSHLAACRWLVAWRNGGHGRGAPAAVAERVGRRQ